MEYSLHHRPPDGELVIEPHQFADEQQRPGSHTVPRLRPQRPLVLNLWQPLTTSGWNGLARAWPTHSARVVDAKHTARWLRIGEKMRPLRCSVSPVTCALAMSRCWSPPNFLN